MLRIESIYIIYDILQKNIHNARKLKLKNEGQLTPFIYITFASVLKTIFYQYLPIKANVGQFLQIHFSYVKEKSHNFNINIA